MRKDDLILISVDDHIIEPPDMFANHIPAKYRQDTPRLEHRDDGTDVWVFRGTTITNSALNAVAGRPKEEYGLEPQGLDEIRPGCYDVHERVKDMNAADYIDVLVARDRLIAEADAITAPFDAVLLPSTAMVAPAIAPLEASEDLYIRTNILILRNTFCFNFLDRCALSIPMHRPGEAPCGLMVVGETMGDRRLLAVGQAIEAALLA